MKYNKLPDLDYLKEMYSYEESTGRLVYNKSIKRTKAGTIAGNVSNTGYRRVKLNNRLYYAHRIIYYMYYGIDPEQLQIDHIDGDKLNNRIENLRLATRSQNHHNRKTYKNNKVGIKCIYHMVTKWNEYYYLTIKKDGHSHNKSFPYTPEGLQEAIAYRDQKLKELHGEFARTE